LAKTRAKETAAEREDLVVPDFLKNPKGSVEAVEEKGPKPSGHARAGGVERPGDGVEGYELPPLSMLGTNPNSAGSASSREELEETMDRLQGTLREFGLTSRVVDYVSGPIVTTFRVEMGEGERVSRIRNLEDDIALTLAAEKVRIFAPIPGTSFVGIEIPNRTRQNVFLGDVLSDAKGGPLEVAIGRDSSGRPVVADIAKMPHMLVAGTTGSGKSVMINSMIMSLLMRTTPKQVRLIMIDPKRVEFSCYNGLPHLYVPVVTEPRQAASALQWAVSEMERRLKVFERAGAREIKVYNQMCVSGKLSQMENPPEPMPYLVVIIDELSDLMMVAGKDVEASIVRIAQLARAAGIHLVIATQRPSANVVTGLIKSNIDNRVALKVSSGIDSRVILDEAGAERLLGNGDMLFKYRGLNMQRVLGCYTSDNEINSVVDFIRAQAEPDYHEEILSAVVPGQPGASRGAEDDEDDPLVWEAAQIVVESQLGSTSGLQRRLKVGYARAGRIMDMLEAKGVVGPPDGSKPREVLLDMDGLEDLRVQDAKYREVV
jgi:S-DNA-T family DNA segregation ATPase FtsK/SpoIIIE